MRLRIFLATLAVAAVGAVPAFASSPEVGEKDNGLSICEEQYLVLYEKAHKQFGPEAVGANVVDDGMGKFDAYDLPESVCEAKADTLDNMLHPPAPAPVAEETTVTDETTTTYVEPAATTSTGSGGAIPSYITECESGGDYGAVNPDSGAYGAYQIMPSTADAYGCDLSTVAGQDQCAGEIWSDVGASAWDCG